MQRIALSSEVTERANDSKQTHKPIILMQHPVMYCYCVKPILQANDATKHQSEFHRLQAIQFKEHQICMRIQHKTHTVRL